MASSTLNGAPVMQGRITRPRVGNWVAELQIDSISAARFGAGTAVALELEGGALTFAGVVLRSDSYVQNVTLRIVGGAGGLARLVSPRFYRGVLLSRPAVDALADAGERLSAASDQVALGRRLDFWTMVQQPASEALTSLAAAASQDAVWRVLADGSVFFGVDGYPPSALVEYDLIDFMPLEGVQVLAAERPEINPGETFADRRVSVVEHLLAPDASRVRVLFE